MTSSMTSKSRQQTDSPPAFFSVPTPPNQKLALASDDSRTSEFTQQFSARRINSLAMQSDGVPHQRTLTFKSFLTARTSKSRVLTAFVSFVLVQSGLSVVRSFAHVAPKYGRRVRSVRGRRTSGTAAAFGGRPRFFTRRVNVCTVLICRRRLAAPWNSRETEKNQR